MSNQAIEIIDPHEEMYNVLDPAYVEWSEKLRAESEREQDEEIGEKNEQR